VAAEARQPCSQGQNCRASGNFLFCTDSAVVTFLICRQ
jgi:hypothetical protein